MRINTNVNALLAWRNLNTTNNAMARNIERLSSGYQINRAADDAAGLAIASRMQVQIRGLRTAQRNAQDAISLVQTAEGGLIEVESMLQKMHDLALEASNDSKTMDDRLKIQDEINQLIDEIDRIAGTTEFNTKKLLDGSLSSQGVSTTFQDNSTDGAAAGLSRVSASAAATVGSYKVTIGVSDDGGGNAVVTAAADRGTVLAAIDDGGNGVSLGNADQKLVESGLQNGDVVTIRGKVGGEEVFASLQVDSETTFQNLYDTIKVTFSATEVGVADGTEEIRSWDHATNNLQADAFYIKGQDGYAHAITDVQIAAEGSDGTARTSFNDAFRLTEVQQAADAGDYILELEGPNNLKEYRAFKSGSTVEIGHLSLTFAGEIVVGDDGGGNHVAGTAQVTVAGFDGRATMQIGANAGQTMDIGVDDMSARALNLIDGNGQKLRVTTKAAAAETLDTVKAALEQVSNQRSKLGAYQNRLEHTIQNLSVAEQNLSEAHSRIRDADIALEMVGFTRSQILLQAGTAMLAQANMAPQTVLQLLG